MARMIPSTARAIFSSSGMAGVRNPVNEGVWRACSTNPDQARGKANLTIATRQIGTTANRTIGSKGSFSFPK